MWGGGGGGGGGGAGGTYHNVLIIHVYYSIINCQKVGINCQKVGGLEPPCPPPPSISAAGEELDWAIAISLQKELSEAVSVLKNYDWLFSYTTHDIFPCKQFKPPTGQLLPTIWFKQNITKCQSL